MHWVTWLTTKRSCLWPRANGKKLIAPSAPPRVPLKQLIDPSQLEKTVLLLDTTWTMSNLLSTRILPSRPSPNSTVPIAVPLAFLVRELEEPLYWSSLVNALTSCTVISH